MPVSLQDRLELLEIEARFDWFIDTGDIDGWVDHFTEDGVFEASYGTAHGRDELHRFMEKLESGFSKGKRHVSANHVVEGDGQEARVSGYLVVFEREQAPHVVATGTYVNTYRRTDSGWKVAHRKLDIDPGWKQANGADQPSN
jgi:ketosteroid isomerase-like protein